LLIHLLMMASVRVALWSESPKASKMYVPRLTISCLVPVVATVLWAQSSLLSPALADANDLALIRVVAEGCLNNVTGFEAFSCRFAVSDGLAESRDEALQGRIRRSFTYETVWLVNGAREYVHFRGEDDANVLADLRKRAAAGAEGSSYGKWASTQYLSNGTEQLVAALGTANLFSPDNPPEQGGLLFRPTGTQGIGPGPRNECPAKWISDHVERGGFTLSRSVVAGRSVFVITVPWNDDEQDPRIAVCSFDPQQGYLPVRYKMRGAREAKERCERLIVAAKECGGGRWFPMQSIELDFRRTDKKVGVREYRVLEFKDGPPPESAFTATLPAGTLVVDRRDPKTTFLTKGEEKVGLHEIATLIHRGEAAARERAAIENLAFTAPTLLSTVITIGAIALVVFGLVTLYVRRARRRAVA
jgi:hypothetical protein